MCGVELRLLLSLYMIGFKVRPSRCPKTFPYHPIWSHLPIARRLLCCPFFIVITLAFVLRSLFSSVPPPLTFVRLCRLQTSSHFYQSCTKLSNHFISVIFCPELRSCGTPSLNMFAHSQAFYLYTKAESTNCSPTIPLL